MSLQTRNMGPPRPSSLDRLKELLVSLQPCLQTLEKCLFPKQTCIAVAYDSTLPWCAPRHQSSRTSAAVGSHEWPQHLQLLLELQKLQQHHADKTTANPAGTVMEVEGGDIPEEDEATEYTRMEVTPQDLVHDVGP